jgi:sugar O-acyltransferase (sialic acid O-acetyltransferase NeuD family)
VSQQTLVLVGAGGHAISSIDVIETHGGFAVAGLLGSPAEVGRNVLGYEVIGTDADLPVLLNRIPNALITVGQIRSAETRIRLFETLQRMGFRLPTIISPRAHVSRHATVGEGTIVMHGAIINAGAKVGRNCIVNSNALLEHDVIVADHCHVSTAATLNGDVRVGTASFIGSRAVVREGRTIGDRCVIGMGQSVFADCESDAWVPPRTGGKPA